MADIKETEVSLKVVIDRNKKKVVFAEASSDFVDILFSFLTMPMGTIVRRLANHSDQKVNIGCFNNIYGNVSNLDTMYFETKECKDMLFNTRNSAELTCRNLKINIDDMKPMQHFICEVLCFETYKQYNYTYVSTCCIKDFAALEENIMKLGSDKILHLLECSFLSKTPLSDIFFGNKMTRSQVPTIKSPIRTECNDGDKRIKVKVYVQKSTNNIFLAHCAEDFINFLFSLLTVPLGKVISILTKDNELLSIENMHQSVLELTLYSAHVYKNLTDLSPSLKLEGGFVRGPTKFMVTDDLVVTPLSSMSCFTYLQRLKVPPSDIEEQAIDIGMNVAVHLLRASLTSTSVLSNGLKFIILKNPKQELQ